MSREIKFRAWDKETGKMHYQINKPRTDENINDELIIQFDCTGYSARTKNKYIGSDCLMQYTGIKDKNGKEIYDGDILRINYGDNDGDTYEVIFKEGCYWGKCIYTLTSTTPDKTLLNDLDYWEPQSKEIIGNIHEHKYLLDKNPELITGVKNG